MIRTAAALLPALLLLAACDPAGGRFNSGGSPYAPALKGDPSGEIDGLIVGHRLMAAGEPELALKAYYRAAAEREGVTADLLSAVGSANLALGRLGQAEQALRRALEMDQKFVPAWNNLGVVLMEKGEVAEASRVFKTAFALDSGQSDSIRENLSLALAKLENPAYDAEQEEEFSLVRRGTGEYLLLTKH